ncbi:MAG: DUF819 family protein [Candidatus Omnitrophica bacterium]|nr:DUF819 family protein [Candidatus Omnitrophota bacterium]
MPADLNVPDLSSSILIIVFFVLIVALVFRFTRYFQNNPIIKHLPAPLWCYFLPMIASWVGLIPHTHVIYPAMSKHLLPACLILLLAGAHLRGIWQLGPAALCSMLAGTLAIILGGPLLYLLFKPWLPPDSWMGLGALSASWTGGSANMIAVKEAIHVPESIFSVMVIVDSIVCYVWMGIVMQISSFQEEYDRWNRSRLEWLDDVQTANLSDQKSHRIWIVICILLGVMVSFLPISNTSAIILATALGIGLSFLKKGSDPLFEKIGYFLLYLLLTSIGARANLAGIFQTPIYLLFGISWVLVMGLVLFLVGKIFRIPLFFLATASQANVGGTASATIVAAVYQPHLAFVGLLLAILGNVIGTYLGIGCSYLMRLL